MQRMPTARFFVGLLMVVVGILIIHVLALKLYIYWQVPGFDKVMHFSGGLWLGLFIPALGMVIVRSNIEFVKTRQYAWQILLLSLAVGLLWELFELKTGLAQKGAWSDSLTDLLADVVGVIIGYQFFIKKFLSHEQ